jgi:hypothetical protein
VNKKLAPLIVFFIVIEVLTIMPAFVKAQPTSIQDFYFAGPFDELGIDNTGHKPCIIQAHPYGTTLYDEIIIYTDDGDWTHYQPADDIQYFTFNFTWENASSRMSREYWVDPADPYYGMGNGHAGAGELNIYNQTLYQYTVTFADTSGQLVNYPYVSFFDQAGNLVDRRKMDSQFKVHAGLMLGQKYDISVGSFSIGDFLTTTDLSPEIVVPIMTFPDPVNIGFLYVKAWGQRNYNPSGDSITFMYEDAKANTNNVFVYIYDQNSMTVVNNGGQGELFVGDSNINYIWNDANFTTDYFMVAIINHNEYGRLDYRNVFPRGFQSTSPWNLDFLGTLPFNTSYLIPAFIILVVAGIFSTLNAPVGLFATVVTATFLSYFGWLPIGADILVFCFAIVFIFAIVMARRRYYG